MDKLVIILLFLLCIPSAFAWSVRIDATSELGIGQYVFGVHEKAVDSIDTRDSFLLEPPTRSIALYSEVAQTKLMQDYRQNNLVWEVSHTASTDIDSVNVSEMLSWQLHNVSSTLQLILIDGDTQIDMKEQQTYSFVVSHMKDTYRTFSIQAQSEKTEITQESNGGGSSHSFSCTSQWNCSQTSCENGFRTQTCVDLHSCENTTIETLECAQAVTVQQSPTVASQNKPPQFQAPIAVIETKPRPDVMNMIVIIAFGLLIVFGSIYYFRTTTWN